MYKSKYVLTILYEDEDEDDDHDEEDDNDGADGDNADDNVSMHACT